MKKKIIPFLLLIIAVVAVVELKNRKATCSLDGCPDGLCVLPIPESKLHPEMIGSSPAAATTNAPLPRLLDLGAGKCVPCKAMAPILDEMKETFAGRLDVVFIDVWENEGVSEKYDVRMIPTQIFFDAAGNELFRHEGFFSRADLLAKWAELGYDFSAENSTRSHEGHEE
mgnify:CR=1 FL=1